MSSLIDEGRVVAIDVVFVFFFQAEDGIRDIGVTGVQTCALPIYVRLVGPEQRGPDPVHVPFGGRGWRRPRPRAGAIDSLRHPERMTIDLSVRRQIGRASCRERV